MNRYAQIELVESFEKVRYYSVRFEGASQNLFDEFINEFEESEDLDELKIYCVVAGTNRRYNWSLN